MILSAACLLTGCAAKPENESSAPQGTTEISAPAAKKNAHVTIDGTKFMVDGKELWINGVNTP